MSKKLGMVLVGMGMIAPAVAFAQIDEEQVQRARERFEVGEAAYASSDYEEALHAFEEAYASMEGHPNQGMILFNIARCQDELGRGEAAIESYRRFLEEASEDAPNRTVALERITLLEARTREAAPDDGAAAGAPEQTSTDAAPVAVSADEGGPHPIGPILMGVGGAAVLAGVIVGSYGLAERGDVLSQCAGTTCPPEVEGRAADLETLGIVTDALLWPGIAIAAAGLVLTFTVTEGGGDEPRVACGPTGCTARWQF